MTRHGDHALVIGASMAGLVGAAAIASFYDRVTILERDALPDQPQHRRGVPQGKHAHGLQPGGLRALEELLPGLTDELIRSGAPVSDLTQGCSWHVGGGHLARGVSGVVGVGVTRPYLEHHVRRRVAALPGITIRDRCEVVRPLSMPAGRGRYDVVGLEVAPITGGPAEPITADLVVDAAGRMSRLPRWLEQLRRRRRRAQPGPAAHEPLPRPTHPRRPHRSRADSAVPACGGIRRPARVAVRAGDRAASRQRWSQRRRPNRQPGR